MCVDEPVRVRFRRMPHTQGLILMIEAFGVTYEWLCTKYGLRRI